MNSAAGANLGGGGEITSKGGTAIPAIGIHRIDVEFASGMTIPLTSEPTSNGASGTSVGSTEGGIHTITVWTTKHGGQ